MVSFRIREKVLLHLLQYSSYVDRGEYPVEMTQEGIAEAVGILVSHVPRNVKKLMEEGLVREERGRVRGKTRRVKVYFLTSRGILAAKELLEELEREIKNVAGSDVRLRDLLERGLSPLEVAKALEGGYLEELISKGPMKTESEYRVEYIETFGEEEAELVDREKELNLLLDWYRSDVPTALLTGGRGYGKTTLIKRFMRDVEHEGDTVYLIMHSNRSLGSVLSALSEAAGREFSILKDLVDWMEERNVLLIADEYYLLPEETVEFFRDLVKVPRRNSKLLVGLRENTPFYCRFCDSEDMANGRVTEIRLGEFTLSEARSLFPGVSEEVLRRILAITKGHPQALVLLSRGEEEKLKKMGVLTPEEIKLLMYLAGV